MRRYSKHSSITLTGLAIPLLLAASTADASPPDSRETYSVLTYNVGGLVETAFTDNNIGIWDDKRGGLIADYILEQDYDIVVLNEVFTDDMRNALYNGLYDPDPALGYPWVIREMWDGELHRQDSGLMLFSKFPPAPLSGSDTELADCDGTGGEIDATGFYNFEWDDNGTTMRMCSMAFLPFADLGGNDSWAEKGVGWVRVLNPRTEQPISVVFSHTQANYLLDNGEHRTSVRTDNIHDIWSLIADFAPPARTDAADEAVIVAGDLNIIGDAYYDFDGALLHDSFYEYGMIENPIHEGGFFQQGFRDPWRTDATAFPADVENDPFQLFDWGFSWDAAKNSYATGYEWGDTRERLDYLLDRAPANRPDCVQHSSLQRHFVFTPQRYWSVYGTTVPVELERYLGNDLSDHFGLASVFGPAAERCSPATAAENMLHPGGHIATIEVRNGYHWYRYDQPGTYVLDIDTLGASAPMELELYSVRDLSTPLTPFSGDSLIEPGSVGPDDPNDPVTFSSNTPFYARVRWIDPERTGDYLLHARQNTGATIDDPLILDPFQAMPATMILGAGNSVQRKTYFMLVHDKQPWTGADVGLVFRTTDQHRTDTGEPVDLRLSLVDKHGSLVDSGTGAFMQEATFAAQLGPSSEPIYLLAEREEGSAGEASFTAVWTRDLTTVNLRYLKCMTQEDATGNDHAYLDVAIDDSPFEFVWYGEIDEQGAIPNPTISGVGNVHRIDITGQIEVELWEADDIDADDWLGTGLIYALDPDPAQYLVPGQLNPHSLQDRWLEFTEDGAKYRLYYDLNP